MIVDEYEVMQDFRDRLGKGSSGDVFKGKHLPSGDIVAVKIVKLNEKTEDGREYARKYIMTEVELLRTLRHDNIVKLYHSKKQNDFLYIFLELCDKGDLTDFVLEKGSLSAKMTVSFLRDISRALACLHRHDPVIVHRDVKPENMLVVAKSLDETECSIKLTDFAFSCRAPPGSAGFSATFVGTVQWMAPEIRPSSDGHVRYNEKSDVFSAGLVFHSLIEHVSGTALRARIVDGLSLGEWIHTQQIRGEKDTPPSITKASDNALQTLVKGVVIQMTHPDPSDRCSMEQACNTMDMAYDIPSLAVTPRGGVSTSSAATAGASTSSAARGGASTSSATGGASTSSATGGATSTAKPSKEGKGLKVHKSRLLGNLVAKFRGLSTGSQTIPPSSETSRTEGAKSERARAEGARAEGARSKGARSKGAKSERARAEGARVEGARVEGARSKGAISERARAEGARAEGVRTEVSGTIGGAEGGNLSANLAAVSLKSDSAELRVRKVNQITLTSRDPAILFFGLANFLVGYKNHPDYYYYEYSSKFELVWQKKIPDGLEYNDNKHLPGNNTIYMQCYHREVCQFNRSLDLVEKHSSPGVMICILPGGQDAVVTNNVSPSTETEGVRLSKAPIHNLHAPHYHLDSPDAGRYSGEEVLHACGRQDGRVAVISDNKPFVDIYSETGRYVCRTPLPHGAARPGCSDSHVLIPLWRKPSICVLSWQGELLHTLGPDQLGLNKDDRGNTASPVYEGRFSFFIGSPARYEREVHTYQIV